METIGMNGYEELLLTFDRDKLGGAMKFVKYDGLILAENILKANIEEIEKSYRNGRLGEEDFEKAYEDLSIRLKKIREVKAEKRKDMGGIV